MKKSNLEIGKIGEAMARNYLEKKGYKIIKQNFKTKYCEIDLIAKYKSELVFVEARTKSGERFGSPEETINKEKKRKLLFSAKFYASRIHWQGPYRIDAICIVLRPDQTIARIEHYENINYNH